MYEKEVYGTAGFLSIVTQTSWPWLWPERCSAADSSLIFEFGRKSKIRSRSRVLVLADCDHANLAWLFVKEEENAGQVGIRNGNAMQLSTTLFVSLQPILEYSSPQTTVFSFPEPKNC